MFEVDLGPILGRFGPDLGPKMAPKSPPKTIQKRTKKQLKKTMKKRTKTWPNIRKKPDPAVNGKRCIQTLFVILKCELRMFSFHCFKNVSSLQTA